MVVTYIYKCTYVVQFIVINSQEKGELNLMDR